MEEIRRVLGKKIRDAREEKKVTQKEVGDLLGYSAMAISHFENGIRELKLSDLQKLADFFSKPLNFFFPTAETPAMTFYRAQSTNDPEVAKSLDSFEQHLKSLKNERSSSTH